MIVRVPIPIYVGTGAPIVNAGSISNKGFEFSLGFRGGNAFKYSFNTNASFIKNNLTSLGGGPRREAGGVGKLGSTTMVEEGHPIPYFYGLRTNGIFHSDEEVQSHVNTDGIVIQPSAQAGDVRFIDFDNNGVINNDDRQNLGNPHPKIQYGFNTDFSYKAFDLRLFLQGVQGNKIVNNLIFSLRNGSNAAGGWANFDETRLDAYSASNPTGNQPRMTVTDANKNNTFSDRYVEDGSYLRLKNLQIGYTLPKSLISKWHLNNARIFLASDNLLTITNYTGFDPEVADYYGDPGNYGLDVGNYPQARTFRLGLNVGL
jgi:hypothetical protein